MYQNQKWLGAPGIPMKPGGAPEGSIPGAVPCGVWAMACCSLLPTSGDENATELKAPMMARKLITSKTPLENPLMSKR
jgi:hypothetical protein